MIYDLKFNTKDDSVLQNSNQEPSTSSLWSMMSTIIPFFKHPIRNHQHPPRMTGYQRWFSPPKKQSGTIIVLKAWLCSWHTFNHARELISACNSIMIYDHTWRMLMVPDWSWGWFWSTLLCLIIWGHPQKAIHERSYLIWLIYCHLLSGLYFIEKTQNMF